MKKNVRKFISIVLTVMMVIGAFPMMTFVTTAATSKVYSSGEWNYGSSQINSAHTKFDTNGPFYISMAIADTNFVFMQTEDNQEFTYTTYFYCKKNQVPNSVTFHTVTTNVQFDETFNSLVNSEVWSQTSGTTEDGTDSSPNGDSLVRDNWYSTEPSFITYSYTLNFTADGKATYYPEWNIEFESRGSIGSNFSTYNTAYTVLEGEDEAINVNPVFTIQIIDLRELITLVDMANEVGVDVSSVTNGRDLTGNTYYSQETIDEMVSALRELLLCDYSNLDLQLSNAATIEDNVQGALGGYLYDEDLYAAFTSAYNAAKNVDRYLTEDEQGVNQSIINTAASDLATAINNLIPTRKALISYYSGTELFAQNTCVLGQNFNFHDVTDKFIGTPTQERMVFSKWVDVNGDPISEGTLITGDLNAYADFDVDMDGISPISSSGKWEHKLSENNDDGRGDNYISMWVNDITFNFVQTTDNETFSFYTDLTAYKNDGANTVRVNDVYLLSTDSDTQDFITAMGDHDVDTYCVTRNVADVPNNTALPGQLGSGYSYQSTIYRVIWRYIYTFNADGAATYQPKWNIEYTSGLWSLSAGDHDLPDGGDPYVTFTINVTDIRELINLINKAESVYNNRNSGFTQDDLNDLRDILDYIYDNYTLDGSVYYEQSEIDDLIDQIKAIIPDDMTISCDYTDLDEAIALAEEKIEEYDNNSDNHFINEVWNNFLDAYTAATTVDRNLYIIESNANQTMIDGLTADLLEAINALTYQTHVNQPCDYTEADSVLDEADGINNDNGKYDDDAYQIFEDAKEALEELLNLYDDEEGDNQSAIDDAVQALQDAIDALTDAANQNDPCDYSTLDALIAQASAINNDSGLITNDSYQDLQDALSSALAVDRDLYDNGTNQMIVNAAALNLYNAINSLEFDKTSLQDLLTQANAVYLDDYTSATAQDLSDAISQGTSVLNDDDASLSELINAISDLEDAINNLVPDKTELQETITAAESIDDSKLDATTAQTLQDAINDAQDVYDDPDATVAEINEAIATLNAIIDGILDAAITEAENVDTTGMTSESVQALEDAIDDAQAIQGNDNASAQDKADAINDIFDEIDNLTVDKAELQDTVDAAETVDTTDLDSELADALSDAIDNGNDVLDDPDATVSDVQDAIDQIIDALKDILEDKVNDAEEIDTSSYSDDTIADLQDAIDAANDILNDPDASADDIADAIKAIEDAIENLSDTITITVKDNEDNIIQEIEVPVSTTMEDIVELLDLVPTTDDDEILVGYVDESGDYITDDTEITGNTVITPYYELGHLVTISGSDLYIDRTGDDGLIDGFDISTNTVAEVKLEFENDELCIEIVDINGNELTDSDKVGTASVITYRSKLTGNVYERLIAIVYGDVDGDGIVGSDDLLKLKNVTYSTDTISENTYLRMASDANGDTAFDGFDCTYISCTIHGISCIEQSRLMIKA